MDIGQKVAVRLTKRSKDVVSGEVVDTVVRVSQGKLEPFVKVWLYGAARVKVYPASEVHPYGVTD